MMLSPILEHEAMERNLFSFRAAVEDVNYFESVHLEPLKYRRVYVRSVELFLEGKNGLKMK